MKWKFYVILVTICLILTPTFLSASQIEAVNFEGKDKPNGHAIAEITGTCGKDFKLISPTNATMWYVNITVTSEIDQPIHIIIIDIEMYESTGYAYKVGEGQRTCSLNFKFRPF